MVKPMNPQSVVFPDANPNVIYIDKDRDPNVVTGGKTAPPPKYKVGDSVWFLAPGGKARALVVEVRDTNEFLAKIEENTSQFGGLFTLFRGEKVVCNRWQLEPRGW